MTNNPEEVDVLLAEYEGKVKPAIERKDYQQAYEAMSLLNAIIIRDPGVRNQILKRTHCAWTFMGAALQLEEILKGDDQKKITEAKEFFEAYAAQTQLPRGY